MPNFRHFFCSDALQYYYPAENAISPDCITHCPVNIYGIIMKIVPDAGMVFAFWFIEFVDVVVCELVGWTTNNNRTYR